MVFPGKYKSGIRYAIVGRGNILEEIYANREAIGAAKKGQPLPSNTVITMEDCRDGRLFRYVIMEKREGWGGRYAQDIRNGDWECQSFRPDRAINRTENVARCMGCHKPQDRSDHVFTLDRMRDASLGQMESYLCLATLTPEVNHRQLEKDAIAPLTREHEVTANDNGTN